MIERDDELLRLNRRQFLGCCGYGVGTLALGQLLSADLMAAASGNGLHSQSPHFPPTAKNVIFLFMSGGPPHVDLFDPKPTLTRMHGDKVPESLIQGEKFAFLRGVPKLHASPYQFLRHGKSGTPLSELLPHLATVVDDLAIVRSVQTDSFNHSPAQMILNTGVSIPGRPSMGSWVTYGLGTENRDLPGFVVLVSGQGQPIGAHLWGSGFLPTVHQGVRFRSEGDPVLYLSDPQWIDSETRKASIEAIADLDRERFKTVLDPEIQTRISSYELAYRMQSSVPELMNIDDEPESIQALYGTQPGKVSFANNCLLARRLVEKGVRFVQLFHRGWDQHRNLIKDLPSRCRETDRPVAALIQDLKNRGLLGETLVVWGGEFGRTPMAEGVDDDTWGRDHHPKAFTIWMAGGGVQGGVTYGATDDLGYNVTENPIDIHDVHATILHCLGLEHRRLTYDYLGRDFRLTDVAGKVVGALLRNA